MVHLYFGDVVLKESFKSIYFSMGCFWSYEPLFWDVKGVVLTEVGYVNVGKENPSCEDVFKENISHREVVRIFYAPQLINENTLLDIFFKNHTIDEREDFPVPLIYRSGVFVENDKDYELCLESIKNQKKIRKENNVNYPIATTIEYVKNYKKADEKHQQYALKNKHYTCYHLKKK